MILTILASTPLVLAAIAGLVMMAWMPKPTRPLAAIGLVLVLGDAVWNIAQPFLLDLGLPMLVLDIAIWVSYLLLIVGLGLLALAATARPKHTAGAAPHGYSSYPSAPHHHPAPPRPHTPEPGGTDPRPGT